MEPTAEELERAARKEALAEQIFALLAAAPGGDPSAERASISGQESIDALAFVLALMVEYSPHAVTAEDIQKAAENLATDVHRMAHHARAVTNETGRHPIEMFGASNRAFVPSA